MDVAYEMNDDDTFRREGLVVFFGFFAEITLTY